VKPTLALKRLKQNGIEMDMDDTFRGTADKYETMPIEIVKVILIDDYSMKRED